VKVREARELASFCVRLCVSFLQVSANEFSRPCIYKARGVFYIYIYRERERERERDRDRDRGERERQDP